MKPGTAMFIGVLMGWLWAGGMAWSAEAERLRDSDRALEQQFAALQQEYRLRQRADALLLEAGLFDEQSIRGRSVSARSEMQGALTPAESRPPSSLFEMTGIGSEISGKALGGDLDKIMAEILDLQNRLKGDGDATLQKPDGFQTEK